MYNKPKINNNFNRRSPKNFKVICRSLIEKQLGINSDKFIPMKYLETHEDESYIDIIIEVFHNGKKHTFCITQFFFNATFYVEEVSVSDIETYTI